MSGGGVRLFTTKLLEEFSRLAGDKWRFHLMWPLFDSGDNFLPQPTLPNTTFERIGIDRISEVNNKAIPCLYDCRGELGSDVKAAADGERIKEYIRSAREHEQGQLRSGTGLGLKWLNERINKFDLIYFPYPYLTLPREQAWRPARPAVITLHDLAHEKTDAWGEMTELLRREVRRWTRLSDLVIFSSEYIRRESQEIYGLPPERTKRIYLAPEENGTNMKFQDEPERYHLGKEYVFTLGWAARHKRVETIIEGFSLFRKMSGRDVALVMAGPRTEQLLNEKTFGLDVGRDLFALGYVSDEDIPALYLNSSLVVTSSVSEAGLNAMIFDAMKYERAVACSRIPQFVERLGTDDALALMFDPDSPQSLADAIGKHFSDPARAKLRVERAKRFIGSRTLAEVGEEYLKAFESVLWTDLGASAGYKPRCWPQDCSSNEKRSIRQFTSRGIGKCHAD